MQLLFELTQDLGSSLSLDETLSVVAARLKRLVPYDAIAVYVCREGRLVPEYVNGESFRFLSSLQIPIGQGLSGWVAQTGRTVLNGNPAVESGYLDDPSKFTTLRSAVAVPLVGLNGTIGVMTLYRTDKRRILRRPRPRAAGHQFQGVAGHGQRPEVPPGGDHAPPPITSRTCPTPARCSCAWTANWRGASGPASR